VTGSTAVIENVSCEKRLHENKIPKKTVKIIDLIIILFGLCPKILRNLQLISVLFEVLILIVAVTFIYSIITIKS